MLSGDLFIDGEWRAAAARFLARNPSEGTSIPQPGFAEATAENVAAACAAAEAAFGDYAARPLP